MFFVAIFMMASMNAQSIQWHQSYDGNQKFVSDFFWNNDNYNVYSYNEFTVSNNQSVGYGIIYGEYRLNKSHFLVHAETRFRTAEVHPSMRSITSGETIEETTFTEVDEEKVPIKIKGKYF